MGNNGDILVSRPWAEDLALHGGGGAYLQRLRARDVPRPDGAHGGGVHGAAHVRHRAALPDHQRSRHPCTEHVPVLRVWEIPTKAQPPQDELHGTPPLFLTFAPCAPVLAPLFRANSLCHDNTLLPRANEHSRASIKLYNLFVMRILHQPFLCYELVSVPRRVLLCKYAQVLEMPWGSPSRFSNVLASVH